MTVSNFFYKTLLDYLKSSPVFVKHISSVIRGADVSYYTMLEYNRKAGGKYLYYPSLCPHDSLLTYRADHLLHFYSDSITGALP